MNLLSEKKYYELITLFLKDYKKQEFWNELNNLIELHNDYYKYLSIDDKLNLAADTNISNIKNKQYNNFYSLREGIILFPVDKKLFLNDLELIIYILRRCNIIYNYPRSFNLLITDKNENIDKKFSNIIFMFLGGLPSNNDEHYKNFFKTTNKSFYIIVHPQKLEGYIEKYINTNDFYKKLYDNGQLLVVDLEHHVRTKWATFSLVSAVLLMIQYSLKQKGNIFKKFVLVSSNDKPLYNYNIIHNVLNSDDKSWLYYSNDSNGYSRYFLKKSYFYEGGVFSTDDVVYVSQWMALDIKHIIHFINFKGDNFITYKKSGEITCGKDIIDRIISVNKGDIYDKYLSSFIGSYKDEMTYEELKDVLNNGNCIGTDEYFFGVILKHFLKNSEEFKNNIRFEYISNLNKHNAKQYINSVENENKYLEEFKSVYENNNNLNNTENYRTWYGSSPKFGTNKFKIHIIKNNKPNENKTDAFFIVKNNKILTISEEQLKKLKSDGLTYYDTLNGGSSSNDNKYDNNIYFEQNENNYNLNDIYSISSTYTDWSIVNANPSNLFRDFNINLFKLSNNIFDTTNIIIKMIDDIEPLIIINNYISKSKRTDDKIYDEFVKGPSYHPIEYLTYTLLSILNSYNFIVFLDLSDENKTEKFYNNYKKSKEIYYNIITKNIENIEQIKIENKIYYVFKDKIDENIKKTMYGHPITSFSLNNALAYGALFIRKVMDNSLIEKYTNQLMNLEQYVLNNYEIFKNRDEKYIDKNAIIFNNTDEIKYKKKYLKYKKKYLNKL
jgi:hypothetical protein